MVVVALLPLPHTFPLCPRLVQWAITTISSTSSSITAAQPLVALLAVVVLLVATLGALLPQPQQLPRPQPLGRGAAVVLQQQVFLISRQLLQLV